MQFAWHFRTFCIPLCSWTSSCRPGHLIFRAGCRFYPACLNVVRPVTGAKLTTMKLESEIFKSIFTPELLQLKALFEKYNHEIRIAGGAVRDLLMDIRPTDIDLATTATPNEMIEMFNEENVRMLNKRGEKHGTVTCRINDSENFEVTTLRIDVLCDGRRAEVEFTTDWMKDAGRRDLTINSMFVDFDGTVYDYFGGLKDLKEKRIAFVGVAEERIREDYLRILRYFRFYGRIAEFPDRHEQSTLDAITKNVEGLGDISGERIWFELKKIIVGNHGDALMRVMLDCGVGAYIGLPDEPNVEEFCVVYKQAVPLNAAPMTILASLLNSAEEVHVVDDRLKLSVIERLMGVYIVLNRDRSILKRTDEEAEREVKSLCFDVFSRKAEPDTIERICELLKYLGNERLLTKLRAWEPPVFPVKGNMIADDRYLSGPSMALVLARLFENWRDSGYTMNADQLLDSVKSLPPIEELRKTYSKVRHEQLWKKPRRR